MESMPAVVRTMIDLYEFTEVELSRLLRWKRFVPDDVLAIWQALHEGNSGVGLQPVSVHAFSLGAFVDFMIDRLCRYVSLDRELLQLCVRYHDHGEGLLGRDVFKHEKSSHDVEEYLATMQHFRAVFDGQVPGLIYRAYLLQHCLTNPEDFPSEARAVMAELGRIYRHEARALSVWRRSSNTCCSLTGTVNERLTCSRRSWRGTCRVSTLMLQSFLVARWLSGREKSRPGSEPKRKRANGVFARRGKTVRLGRGNTIKPIFCRAIMNS